MNRQARRAAHSPRCQTDALDELSKMRGLAKANVSTLVKREVCGWSFVLDVNGLGRVAPDGSDWWHLSAMLQPAGRSSTGEDWKLLGTAMARIGVPNPGTALVTPFDCTPPNAVHHWSWTDSGWDGAVPRMQEALNVLHPERSCEGT